MNQHKPFFPVVLPLLILWGFIHHFNIESQFNLSMLFPLIGMAFLVHSSIPMIYRSWVFVGATLLALFIVLSVFDATFLIISAFSLIGLCNLPIKIKWRKLLILVASIFLGYIRLGYLGSLVVSSALTLLGSMFMFRLILFLYEMEHQKEPTPVLTQISYFFMLPNVAFPLFPVVDFKLFRRQYFDKPALEIYQRGIYLISKGMFFLFLYRIIYSFLLPSVSQINGLYDFLRYIFFSYLLTIRLAGIFHFSVGVLHLFGHRLPDVFDHHFFASGFADLWKRINIYWKDFIVKVYFNPLYFKLKHLGTKKALFITTIISFALTLFFHQYQTFWITGVLTLRINDVIFWGFFGLIIALGTIQFIKLPKTFASNPYYNASKILLTFFIMALLWSFWESAGLKEWLDVITSLKITPIEVLKTVAVGCCIILSGGLFIQSKAKFSTFFIEGYNTKASIMAVCLVVLALVFNSVTLKHFWNDRLDGNDIHRLFNTMVKDEEVHEQIAGYYDQILVSSDLMNPAVDNGVMWSKMFQINLYQSGIMYKSHDAYKRKMEPSRRLKAQGIDMSTNSHGMYDIEYRKEPDEQTYRVAILGASIEMGWAIPYHQGFEKVIEDRLRAEWIPKEGITKIELLNFSVPSRNIINHCYTLQNQVIHFRPDMVVVFDHDETEWINIASSLSEYNYAPYFKDELEYIYNSGILNTESTKERVENLEHFRVQVMKQFYSKIYNLCDSIRSKPILVEMPELHQKRLDIKYSHHRVAESVGFGLIDLSELFSRNNLDQYAMDIIGHPTLEGNQRIADALYDELLEEIVSHLEEDHTVE